MDEERPKRAAAQSAAAASAAETAKRTAARTRARAKRAAEAKPAPETRAAATAAEATEAAAGRALEEAERAEAEALAAAEAADELLLGKKARELAAQVTEDQPFGRPGRRGDRNSPFRWGLLVTAGALVAITLGRAITTVEHQILLVVVAAFIAIGLDPAVRLLTRRGMRRRWAVAVIALAFLGAVAGFVAAALPPLVDQGEQLTTKAPHYLKELNDRHSFLGRLNLHYHVAERVKEQVSSHAVSPAGVLHIGRIVLSTSFEVVIVLVLVVYFLADMDGIKSAFYRLAPKHRRPRVGLLGDEILDRVGGYVLGNVLTSIVAAVTNYAVLLVLHVPYALVLSLLVGILDLIPLVGSTIGGAIVALVALATVSAVAAIVTAVYHVLYRLFEDYWLNPRVLRRTVDVSPLVTIIAVLIGGALLGIVGALLAVPVAAACQLVLQEVIFPLRDVDAGDAGLRASGAGGA